MTAPSQMHAPVKASALNSTNGKLLAGCSPARRGKTSDSRNWNRTEADTHKGSNHPAKKNSDKDSFHGLNYKANRCAVCQKSIRKASIVRSHGARSDAERPRSAARGQGIIHNARFYRESAASLGSAPLHASLAGRSFGLSVRRRMIRRASDSLISRCLGTGCDTPVAGLRYQSCLPPCRTKTHPPASIDLIRSTRFMASLIHRPCAHRGHDHRKGRGTSL